MSKYTVQELMPGLVAHRQSEGGVLLPSLITPQTGLKTQEDYDKDELDLEKMVADIIKTGNRIPPDLRIDDRDLKEFPNFYTFCRSKQGLNQKPFARQLALATYLLAESCPRCTKPAFYNIHKIPVDFDAWDIESRVTFLEFGVCPKCQVTKSKLYKNGELRVPIELDVCLGQRAGKSALLRLLAPYIIHKWVKMNKPVQTLGLLNNDILTGTFVGLTFAKAIELLWAPIMNAVNESPWFVQLHKTLDYYGEKHGIELYRSKDQFLNYFHKALYLSPSGPNKRTLRGATRFLAFIDELGWFPHGEENEQMERASANEVYVSLDNSLLSVRGASQSLLEQGYNNIPQAYMGCISSPSSYMDKIMSLIRANEGSEDVVTAHMATWDMNPTLPRTHSFFAKKYREDPVKAERDFGANPPMSENPWMSNIDAVNAMITNKKNRVSYKYAHMTNSQGQQQRYAEVVKTRPPEPCPGTIMSLDQGYANNSLGVSIIAPTLEGNAHVLAVVEVAPQRGKNVLNYTHLARSLLYPLIEDFNVKLVVADRWQSIKLLQDIEDEFGIHTLMHTLTVDNSNYIYDCVMDDEDQIIKLPALEMSADEIAQVDLEEYPHCFKYTPIAHLYHQFMTATVTKRGIMDKGAGYTDDLLRSLAVGLTVALDGDMVEEYEILGSRLTVRHGPVGTSKSSTVMSSSLGVKSGSSAGSSNKSSLGARG